MSPRVQIPKEKILETALQLLIRDGYEAITIKAVAKELGTSTQPISWTFGNMENFRTALAEYALAYANQKMHSDSYDSMEAYGKVGTGYVDMAYDEPNLIRFLRLDEKRLQGSGGLGGSFDEKAKADRRKAFAGQYGCTEEEAEKFMLNMMIYTQGLVSMILAGGINIAREDAHQLLHKMAGMMIRSFAKEKSMICEGEDKNA
ncbi:MAG: TetR/AcrR family transcriptional regulator [Roseburia sp.]|uniref:helix-turn-helix domain-containing protein n=1 Tax=Roseburia hominis TaxID=301301 RepID=UPI001F38399C|nr:helix-turn-helix transcriptional regulator [Roseburia hominis]MCI5712152.1 TetR/AcrR family transcriptional regulator [Lachnospiraceae bacterium]